MSRISKANDFVLDIVVVTLQLLAIVAMVLASILFIFFLFVWSDFLYGLAVYLLWNGIVPAIFGLPELSYLKAVGLVFLCTILFKGRAVVKVVRNQQKM